MAKATDRMRLEQDNLKLVKKGEIGYICQYTTMTDIGRELKRIEKFYQMLLRVYPAVKRRIRKWFFELRKKSDADMVKVLSYPQIKSTLNDKGYFKGLSFQENMEKYCNNTYKVLKLPQYVLDQGGRKINRCKDVVILRGLYCNGKGTVLEEGCDRCCLHYWKTDWLKKVV
jgi:hypothetical protein